MIAIDTNVLVRFLVHDDAEQSARASALFRRAQDNDETLFIPSAVVCEFVWVLRRAYRVPKHEIVKALVGLVRARHIAFETSGQVEQAIAAYERGRADFADYLIREQAWSAGCDTIATFDSDVAKENGFDVI